MIAGLLLAAGAARRFGGPKLLEELHGRPIVRWSVDALRHPAIDAMVAVVPPGDAALRRELAASGIRVVDNPDAARGMSTSIACGVRALPSEARAVVVALADEPLLDPRWVDVVLARYRQGDAAIVAPVFRGIRRHPVLFDRSVFPELLELDGDRGAKDIVDRDPARVVTVVIDEPGTFDVDTRDDLERIRRMPPRRGDDRNLPS